MVTISSEGTSRVCARSLTLASMCFLFTSQIELSLESSKFENDNAQPSAPTKLCRLPMKENS